MATPMPVYVLAGWTILTWGTRITNAAQDAESLLVFIIPLALVGLAAAAIAKPARLGRLLAVATSVAWLLRVPVILLGGHGAGFVVVHLLLAGVTWALAAWILRVTAPHRATA